MTTYLKYKTCEDRVKKPKWRIGFATSQAKLNTKRKEDHGTNVLHTKNYAGLC